MADVRTAQVTLEDSGSEAGVPLHRALEGETVTAKNAQGAFVAKKDGNFVYLNLDGAGNLLTTMDGGGICKRAGTDGTPVTGSMSKTNIAEITLDVGKVFRNLSWTVANFRDTIYDIELIDDPAGVPSIVQSKEILVGAGDLTSSGRDHCFEFDTTGLTAPVLRISGTNTNAPSDFRGSISITQDMA